MEPLESLGKVQFLGIAGSNPYNGLTALSGNSLDRTINKGASGRCLRGKLFTKQKSTQQKKDLNVELPILTSSTYLAQLEH